MKLTTLALMGLLTTSCFALTPEEIDEIIDQALSEETTRAVNPKSPHERHAALAKRVDKHLAHYCTEHKINLQTLPEELRNEVIAVTSTVAARLIDKAKDLFVTDQIIKKTLAQTLSTMVNPTVRYLDKKDLAKHLDAAIADLHKRVGMGKNDGSKVTHRETARHKEHLHKRMLKQLERAQRSYTTDQEVHSNIEASLQLLLKQMWSDIQQEAHRQALAYIAKHHAHDSRYVMPPEAKRLQKVADAIRGLIKEL